MGSIIDKLSGYWQEAAFASRATRTWTDQYALLCHTARFHIRNLFGHVHANRSTFTIDLRIDRDRPATLTLRTFAGDLFVLYEVLAFDAYHIAPTLLSPDDVRVIVDCGANIGITALYLAARYRNARLFSIEPDPDNFALLTANVAHEPRIVPIHACVTGQPQSMVQLTADQPAWGNKIAVGDAGIAVPAITLAQLCDQYDLERIDLLKLDIEGAEEQVLANGGFLNRVEHVIIELHGNYDIHCLQRDIAPYGFAAQKPEPPATRMVTARRQTGRLVRPG